MSEMLQVVVLLAIPMVWLLICRSLIRRDNRRGVAESHRRVREIQVGSQAPFRQY
jgi:hypothetical protein